MAKLNLIMWDMTLLDRDLRNATNQNWEVLMDYANEQASEQEALYAYMEQLKIAEEFARKQADDALDEKLTEEIEVQKQRINELILGSGDTNIEVTDARVDVHGFLHDVLKERLDNEQLAREKKSTIFYSKEDMENMLAQDIMFMENELSNSEEVIEQWLILDQDKSEVTFADTDYRSDVSGKQGQLIIANFGEGKRFNTIPKALITANDYQLGNAYLTGEVFGEPPYWSFRIDGVEKPGGATDGNTFKIYISGKVTSVNQIVEVVAYADSARTVLMGKAIVRVVE